MEDIAQNQEKREPLQLNLKFFYKKEKKKKGVGNLIETIITCHWEFCNADNEQGEKRNNRRK